MLGFEKGDRVQRGDKREVVGKLGFLRVVNPLNSEKREREREGNKSWTQVYTYGWCNVNVNQVLYDEFVSSELDAFFFLSSHDR